MTRVLYDTVYTPHLERDVLLRRGGSDRQVWGDTFTGQYHLPHLRPGSILDVGANIGLTAAHYQYLYPDAVVVATEPDPYSFAVARQNFGGQVLPYAVGRENGWRRFEVHQMSHASHLSEDGEIEVETMRLSTLIDRAGFGRVDFVKLDVEGAEWEVLDDIDDWGGLVTEVLIELHGAPSLLLNAVRILANAGFDARTHHWHPQAVHGWKT